MSQIKSIIPNWLSDGALIVLFPALFVAGSNVLGVGVLLLYGVSAVQIWDLIKSELIALYQLLLALVFGYIVQLLALRATAGLSQSFYARLPLTPQRRVKKLLCNSDKGLEHLVLVFLYFATFAAIRTGVFWSQERSIRIGATFVGIIVIGITIRWGIRNGHRTAITDQLNQERCKWDPEQKNPKVFVSKRDTLPNVAELFDRLTHACYERGLTVLQYTDFEWPIYSEEETPVNKHPLYLKHHNPQAVAIADVIVWLDIGAQTKFMEAELEEANKLHLKMVRLAQSQINQDDFIIGAIDGQRNRVPKKDAPEYLGDLLRQILTHQTTY